MFHLQFRKDHYLQGWVGELSLSQLTQEENETIMEVSKFIDEQWRKEKCPKNLHMISQSVEELVDNGYRTFCCVCGAILQFQETKDGSYEWVNKSN